MSGRRWIFAILVAACLSFSYLVYIFGTKTDVNKVATRSRERSEDDGHTLDAKGAEYEAGVNNVKEKSEQNSIIFELVVLPFLNYHDVTDAQSSARGKEYKEVLQRNLNNPFVKNVHLLTTERSVTEKEYANFTNHDKLIIAVVNSTSMSRDPWDYISQNLVGKFVMFGNADIYIGTGYEMLDPDRVAKDMIMYSLSRSVNITRDKCMNSSSKLTKGDRCVDPKFIRWDSHDNFLFYLHEPLPEEFLSGLEFVFPAKGGENVLMWLFREKLHYCVINPCTILTTYHLHCSDVRNRDTMPRVNNENNSAHAHPTNDLYCSVS